MIKFAERLRELRKEASCHAKGHGGNFGCSAAFLPDAMRAATAARTMRNWWPWRTISALPRTICWGGATCGVESVSCACWGRRPRRPAGKTSPGMCRGGYQPPGEMQAAGRRPRGSGSRQGACPAGCTPHFLFHLVEKKTGRARSKRKDRLDALRRVRASARRGSADRCKRRFWPAFGHAMHLLRFLGLPSRGGWCGGRRGGYRIVSASLFAAAGRPARELVQRADVDIRPKA